MIPASDRYVSKTDNGCPDDAKPKKAPRPIDRELLVHARDAAGLIAKRLKVGERRALKPRSGDDALSVRRTILYYLQGKNYPIWMLAQIFDIDRGTVTEDLQFIQRIVADDEDFDTMMDSIIEGTDAYMRVEPGAFVNICLAELEADRAAAQALQTIRQARKTHERAIEQPKQCPPESVIRALEGLPEDKRKIVLERWYKATPLKVA
jgi:hypothetical protein